MSTKMKLRNSEIKIEETNSNSSTLVKSAQNLSKPMYQFQTFRIDLWSSSRNPALRMYRSPLQTSLL